MGKGVTPLCGLLGEWRPLTLPAGEKHKACGETSPRILHSSCAEEKKLGFAFSKNGPSAIQGDSGATSPFSHLGEWEEGGVTTPSACFFNDFREFIRAECSVQCSISQDPISPSTSFHFPPFFCLFAQITKFNCKGNPKYNQPGRANATRVESRNNAHLRYIHPR